MSIESIIGNAASQIFGGARAHSQSQALKPAPQQVFAKVLNDFLKEATKTPAERARDDVLKRHGMSEQDYQGLPADQKKAIDQEIVAAVQHTLRAPGQQGSQLASLLGGGAGLTP
jgi:hypothetical protein